MRREKGNREDYQEVFRGSADAAVKREGGSSYRCARYGHPAGKYGNIELTDTSIVSSTAGGKSITEKYPAICNLIRLRDSTNAASFPVAAS